jgi:hypothetical protein
MTLNATYIHKNFAPSQVAFTPITQGECTVDLTDCKEEPILLVDTSACTGDVALTMAAGDYASAKTIPAITLPAGGVAMVPVSTGEVMQADGCLHLTFASFSGATAAVLKKRYVTNH